MEECKTKIAETLHIVKGSQGNLSKKRYVKASSDLQTALVALNNLSDCAPMIQTSSACTQTLKEVIDSLEAYQSKTITLSRQGRMERLLKRNKLKRRLDDIMDFILSRLSSLENSSLNTVYSPVSHPMSAHDTTLQLLRDSRANSFASTHNFEVPDSTRGDDMNPFERMEQNQKLDVVWNHYFGEKSFTVSWEEFVDIFKEKSKIQLNPAEENLLQKVLDNSNTGCVTRTKFSEFLKSFGPLRDCVKNTVKIMNSPWFRGYMTLEESQKYLESEPIGTFLVRFSNSKPGAFSLDYVRAITSQEYEQFYQQPLYGPMESKPNNVRLSIFPPNAEAEEFPDPSQDVKLKVVYSVLVESVGIGFKLKENYTDKLFKSLHEVLHQYRNVLTRPFISTLPNEPWFFGTINASEAEQMLQDQPPGSFIVRFSSQPGCFACSFVDSDGAIRKSLIRKERDGFILDQIGEDDKKIYYSIQELVEEYQRKDIFSNASNYYDILRMRSNYIHSDHDVHSCESSFVSTLHGSPSSVDVIRSRSHSNVMTMPLGNMYSHPYLVHSSDMNQMDSELPEVQQHQQFQQTHYGIGVHRESFASASNGTDSHRPSVSSESEASRYYRDDVQFWSEDDVQAWLEIIHLEELKPSFAENRINGIALLDLNELDMRNELQMVFGHRKLLLKALQEFL